MGGEGQELGGGWAGLNKRGRERQRVREKGKGKGLILKRQGERGPAREGNIPSNIRIHPAS